MGKLVRISRVRLYQSMLEMGEEERIQEAIYTLPNGALSNTPIMTKEQATEMLNEGNYPKSVAVRYGY